MRIPIKYTIIKTLAATFLLASAYVQAFCALPARAEGVIWNTVYHMTFDGDESLADSIRPVLERVGRSLSVFDPESLISAECLGFLQGRQYAERHLLVVGRNPQAKRRDVRPHAFTAHHRVGDSERTQANRRHVENRQSARIDRRGPHLY